MKIKLLFILVLFSLVASQSMGYVLVYEDITFYADDLTVTFLSETNMTYLEIGNRYIKINDLNLSISCTSNININISGYNSSKNLTSGTTVLRFNATYTSGTVTFRFTGNHTNAIYSVDKDETAVLTEEYSNANGRISFSITFASTHDIDITLDGYAPDPPYGGASDYYTGTETVNLTWENGNYSDYDIVLRRNDTYPTSPTDSNAYVVGNYSVNGSNFHNQSLITAAYFRVYSLNSTTWYYSTTGLDIPWGAVNISAVRNESNMSEALTFDVHITNEQATKSYDADGQTAPLVLDYNDIPWGLNTIFQLSATDYKTRVYYKDLYENNYYNYTFYLPPKATPSGGDDDWDEENLTDTNLYSLHVINEYEQAIEDVLIQVRRYNNVTDTYVNVTELLTDAYGNAECYLIPDTLYKIVLSKTGYETAYEDYIPDPDYYGAYYPKTFMLLFEIEGGNITTFLDLIDFNATISSNGTIHVWYADSDTNTTNTKIQIYDYYNNTKTLLTTNTTTDTDSLDFEYYDADYNHSHAIVLFLNHSKLGYEVVWIYIMPYESDTTSEDYVEDMFVNVFGDFDLGWVKTFLIFLPCIIPLVIFGQNHVGLGIIISGVYLGFTTFFIDVASAVTYTSLGGIVIVMGLTLVVVKKGRKAV